MNKDYYKILGVEKSASADELKKAYRTLSKKYHPDLQQGKSDSEKKDAEEKFKDINEAYSILGDPDKKQKYDMFGSVDGGPGGFGAGGFDPMKFFRNHFPSGFGDFGFGFGSMFGHDPDRDNPDSPKDGTDVQIIMEISFEEAVFGLKKEVTVRFSDTCVSCRGTGAKDGITENCPTCRGRGFLMQQFGPTSFQSSTCHACGGTGRVAKDACPECGGRGNMNIEKTISVVIPPGSDTGLGLRLCGRGRRGINGGKDGDLYLVLNVRADEVFQRNGLNLSTVVYVPFTDAIPGTKVEIPTPYGTVETKLPASMSADGHYHVKIPGGGVKQTRNGKEIAGFMCAEIIPEIPTNLSDRQRELLDALKDSIRMVDTPMRKSQKDKVDRFNSKVQSLKK